MLSRAAEALFWIGRYAERAEDTARLLDVYFHDIVENPEVDEVETCRIVATVMGLHEEAPLTAREVLDMLAFDVDNQSSIVGSLRAARQNARGVREALSADIWESLNTTDLELPRRVSAARQFGPAPFFSYVRQRSAMLAGYVTSTISRDTGYDFLLLGRSLERVDMTARLLAAAVSSSGREGIWLTTLRACSAHEAYLRTYQRGVEVHLVLEFLLLDRLFPRSVIHALTVGENALTRLEPPVQRSGRSDSEARRGPRTGARRPRVPAAGAVAGRAARTPAPRRAGHVRAQRERHAQLLRHGRGRRLERRGVPEMSWRIAVKHRTGHKYETPARSSYNEVRMTPATVDGQHALQSRVETSPAAVTFRYVDYWGTIVHAFDVHMPHTELVVTATSVVETAAAGPEPSSVGWSDFDEAHCDRFAELLAPSRYVIEEPELDEVGADLAGQHAPADAGRRAVEWVNEQLDYVRGVTHVSTTSIEARAGGKGVCQDFAHVALALLRATGLPARYVSGYLHPGKDAVLDEPVQAESHAWVEFWAGGWIAVDPSNLSEVGERHVVVARGRDYADVRPLTGIYSGPAAGAVGVGVELTRLR